MIKIIIKVILAGLLLGCLAKVPYGYFQFIRIFCCAGFVWLAYPKLEKNKPVGIVYAALAVLFNPFWKIHFNRKTWNTIDLIIGLALIIWVVIDLYLQYGKGSKKESAQKEGIDL